MYKAPMQTAVNAAQARHILGSIDHSLLTPTATSAELHNLCKVAAHLEVASVCLLPYYVPQAAELLRQSSVAVSTVIAFPHGATPTKAKLLESMVALDRGAVELDVVVNVSAVLSDQWNSVRAEIEQLTELCHGRNARIKLIFENCYLNEAQKIRLCQICAAAGVDWVKTSTGFGQPASGPAGATPDDLQLMRAHCPKDVQVKASGGIRTLAQVRQMLELGATRVGMSRTEDVARELGVLPGPDAGPDAQDTCQA